jgi:hypothetical protein
MEFAFFGFQVEARFSESIDNYMDMLLVLLEIMPIN